MIDYESPAGSWEQAIEWTEQTKMKPTKKYVYAMHTSHQNGERSITLHKTEREALEEIASVYDMDTESMTDAQIDAACDRLGVCVTIVRCEVPE